MDISIIICTWNKSRYLANTIESISRCTIPCSLKWELVIVNNDCGIDTDKTVELFTGKLPIRYAKEPLRGLSRARNKGLTEASGKLVIFSDDDITVSKDWLITYWLAYKDKTTGFYFGGPIESKFEINNCDAELLRLSPPSVRGLDWGNEERALSEHEYFIGANWASPLEYLRQSGGFDTKKGLNSSSRNIRIGEEKDLMRHLRNSGINPWYLPKAKIKHFVPRYKCTLRHIANRWEANGYDQYLEAGEEIKKPFICAIPRWMYKKAFILWLAYCWAKLRGDRGYKEYLDFRYFRGRMKGIHEDRLFH